MFSLLRYSKHIRLISFPARKLINRASNVSCYIVNDTVCNRHLSAVASEPQISSVDRWIRRLDQDVRKTGRVSLKELREAFKEFNRSKATSSQILLLIRCCGNLIPDELPVTKTKFVNDIWETLEREGLLMDVSHYNALLLVYLENEFEFSPIEFLSNMEKKGVEPNRVTYQRLITVYCQQGNIAGTTQILEFMKNKSMPINESVFSSLVTGHSMNKDMDSAIGILKVMEQAAVIPSIETYASLLCAYARNGDMVGLSNTFELIASKGIDISDRQLLEVIYCLCVNGHLSLVDFVISKLQRNFGYNQDAKNVILRLISRGDDDAALRVFRTMTPVELLEDMSVPSGTFLIKQMVKCNRSYESILRICNELMSTKENDRALAFAIEGSLESGKTELALQLLSSLAKLEPVSQHYYWPAIIQFGKAKDEEGILRVLRQIMIDTTSAISNETLRDYVVQFFDGGEHTIQKLKQAGITIASAASALVAHYLQTNNLAEASKICTRFRANYNLAAIRRGIVNAFKLNQDIDSFINIVRCIALSTGNDQEEHKEIEPAGIILMGVVINFPSNAELIMKILEGYLHYELPLSMQTVDNVLNKLGSKVTPELKSLLHKLTSQELHPVPLDRPMKDFSVAKSEALLTQSIEKADQNQESSDGLKINLLKLYTKVNEKEKASQLKQELFDKRVHFDSETLYLLMEHCIQNENLDDAMFYYDQIMKDPSTVVPSLSVIRFGYLLASQNRYDEIIKMLEKHKLPEPPAELNFALTSACWKLLNSTAEKGDVTNTERLFERLKQNNHIMPTNVLLGPLVKVHLVNNDMKSALDAYEKCCTEYRSTPWKNELACKLIQSEDPASLQHLTDLSSQIHGEVNTLYDLVLSFVECGRIRQARKILETPGLRARQGRLNSACERYKNDGRIGHLENLIEATKDINYIDRSLVYYSLLLAYCHQNDVDKAFGLWTQMQDEDVQPSDQFLARLGELLKKNNYPVPFAIPTTNLNYGVEKVHRTFNENSIMKALRRAIYAKDLDTALLVKKQIRDIDMQLNDRSSLLNLMLNNGRLGESTKITIQWLEQGLRPNIRTLANLINNIAKNGDVDSLKRIGTFLDRDLKRLTSYTNRLAHCMVEAGQGAGVIQYLEESISKAKTPQEVSDIKETFPRGGIFSVLQKSQDLVKKFEELEPKYREKGILDPANVLWVHYLLENNSDKMKTVWNHIKGLDRIMFKPVLKKARADSNIHYVDELLENIKDSNISMSAFGAIHSCALDILMNQQKLDDCESRLDEVLKILPLENLNYNTLKRLKIGLENAGRVFKYELPIKARTRQTPLSISSSSDSDDERKTH